MKNLNNYLVALFLIGISFISMGQTCLPEIISTDMTLTKASGPYTVCDETVITESGKLTLESGVELFINNTLIVKGEFNAEGLEQDSVFISSSHDGIFKDKKIIIDVVDFGVLSFNYVKSFAGNEWVVSIDVINESFIKNSSFFDLRTTFNALQTGKHNLSVDSCSFESSSLFFVNKVCNSRFHNPGGVAAERIENNYFENLEFACYAWSENGKVLNNRFLNCRQGIGSINGGNFTVEGNTFENVQECIDISYPEDSWTIRGNSFCGETITVDFSSVGSSPIDLSCNSWCKAKEDIKFQLGTSEFGVATPGADQVVILDGEFANCQFGTKCVPSVISTNLTLTKEGGPYRICNEIIIKEGATLNIEAGVTVQFEAGIINKGVLNVLGTEQDSVFLDGFIANRTGFPQTSIIAVIDSGVVNMQYAKCEADVTELFMSINSKKRSSISNSVFDRYNNVIDVNGDGGIDICSCSFFANNYLIGVRFTGKGKSHVSNCYFNSYRRPFLSFGANIISNCTIKDSEVGILATTETVIINNDLDNNDLAIEIISNESNIASGKIEGNNICGTVYLEEGVNVNLSKNCWCVSSSVSIPNLVVEDKITGSGNYILNSISETCIAGISSTNECFNLVIKNPVIKYSVTGLAHTGTTLLEEGYAFLYSAVGTGFAPVASDTIKNGVFNFTKIDSGSYTVLVVPENLEYIPTYYVNRQFIENADFIDVSGDVTGLDIRLRQVENELEEGVFTHSLILEKDGFDDGNYPVILKVNNGLNYYQQYFGEIASVQNNKLEIDLEGLIERDYEVIIPGNNRKEFSFCLLNSGSEFIVDESCVISSVKKPKAEIVVSISPNPSSSLIQVNTADDSYRFEIHNSLGIIEMEGDVVNQKQLLDISELNSGIHYLTIYSNKGRSTESFIKID